MSSIWRVLKSMFSSRLDPIEEALSKFADQTSAAVEELELQRKGLTREFRHRQAVRAELERAILSATRDAIRAKKLEG